MRIEREVSGFSLIEVLIAVVIMAVAIVPVALTGIHQNMNTSHLSSYVNVMHHSGTILNRLLKEVPFSEIVKDFNIPSGEVEITVADLRSLKFGTPEVEIFSDLNLQAPEDSGMSLGTANFSYYSNRDEAMAVTDPSAAHKVYYGMKIRMMNRTFNIWKNNIASPASAPTVKDSLQVDGQLMKVTLTAMWSEMSAYSEDGKVHTMNKPFQYSLITLKANLTE